MKLRCLRQLARTKQSCAIAVAIAKRKERKKRKKKKGMMHSQMKAWLMKDINKYADYVGPS